MSIFNVKILLEAGRDVARGKLRRVAIILPGVRLKAELLTLIQAAGAAAGRVGRSAPLAGRRAGAGALRVIRTWYVCVCSPVLVFLCCALHVGWITQDFIRETLFLLKSYINKPSAFIHLFEDFFFLTLAIWFQGTYGTLCWILGGWHIAVS